jgi:hypothetical protein
MRTHLIIIWCNYTYIFSLSRSPLRWPAIIQFFYTLNNFLYFWRVERLHLYYDSYSNRIDKTSPLNLLLSINYRTKMEILRFISSVFYGGPDRLISQANLPSVLEITPLVGRCIIIIFILGWLVYNYYLYSWLVWCIMILFSLLVWYIIIIIFILGWLVYNYYLSSLLVGAW